MVEEDPAPRPATRPDRREALRALAALGVAAPLMLTLRPAEARAQGYWAAPGLRDPAAGRPDLFEPQAEFGEGGWVVPYGHEWRTREEARQRAEEARRRRGW
jgi:hypothetical protein